jgi:hypothetical protein
MNKMEVKQLFLIINNCYQNFLFDEIKINIWLDLLREIPFEVAQRNLRKHIKENKFVPTPADIICQDPNQFTDYGKLKSETNERLKRMSEYEKLAIDCPEELKLKYMVGVSDG